MSFPATSTRRNIEEPRFANENPSMGVHRKEPGGASRPVPYVPAEVKKKFERWEREKLKAIARRSACELAACARQQAKENARQARAEYRAQHPPRVRIDDRLLHALYHENTSLPQLVEFFKVSEQTIKAHLKEKT